MTPGKLNFKAHIHGYPHLAKTIIGHIEFLFRKPKDKLFVLNLHGTPKKFIKDFETQLDFLQNHFEIISPNQFFDLLNKKEKANGNKLLLTFDDGLKNNLHALEVLNRKNISALFFIVPEFINSNKPKEFYLKNIRPTINPHIDTESEDFTPLSWEDLKTISINHFIGSHSLSHTMLKSHHDSNFLDLEIEGSKKIIEEKLSITCESFCSINNSLSSLNSSSKALIKKHYTYHFTTIAGCNYLSGPQFIKRINIESFWTIGAIKFSIGTINMNRNLKKISEFESI